MFYEREMPGLGEAFINELELATELLQNYPELGSETNSSFRRLPLRRFPHSLIYNVY